MIQRPSFTLDTRRFADVPEELHRWVRHLRRLGWRLVLWRAIWLPFWFGGDVPAPWLPEKVDRTSLPEAPAARAVATAIDAIAHRVWINLLIASLIRGLWLPFIVGSITTFIQYLRGESFAPERIAWVWAVTIPLSVLFALLHKPDRARTAAMLDRTFGLQDRLKTALEGQQLPFETRNERSQLPYLQLADAANVATGLKSDPRFRVRLPARELSLAILSGLLMLALLFLRGVGGGVPDLAETAVPRFVPAAERRIAAAGELTSEQIVRPPSVAEVEAAAERSTSATADLNTLADALAENALTQPAADAIRAGDYATAAQDLRNNAGQAGELSEESRENLAQALDQASAATASSSPSLSEAASNAAEGLREGGEAATSSMQDLGDAVELAGESVVSQEQLASQMQQAQQAASNGGDQGADAAQSQGAASNPGGSSNPDAAQDAERGNPTEGGSAGGADASAGSASSAGEQSTGGDDANLVDASSGSGEQSGSSGLDQELPGGAAGSGDQPGGNGAESAQPGGTSADESGEAPGSGPPVDSDSANQSGAGASSGGTDQPEADEAGNAGSGQNSGDTATGEPPVEPEPAGASAAAGTGTASDIEANQSIGLSDSGGGASFQLGGGGSASSLGSGAGVMVAGGEASQEAVAEAGPESNRTPEKYRSIVENYFARDS
jgi:hypothetical protein